MVVQEPVQAAVWQCLNHYDYSNALFLAERLYAEVGGDEALFTLATCYYRLGKPKRAYMLLRRKGCPTVQCRYLMAQACFQEEKLSEAESAITGSLMQRTVNLDEVTAEFGDIACFALRLLAKVYSRTERSTKAVECLQRSLKLNPFLWSSFETLCNLGERPDPIATFQVNPQSLNVMCQSSCPSPALSTVGSQSTCSTDTTISESQAYLLNDDSQPIIDMMPSLFRHYIQIGSPEPSSLMTASPPLSADFDEEMSFLSNSNCMRAPRAPTLRPSAPFIAGGPFGFSPLTPSFGVLPLELTPTPANNSTVIKTISHAGIHSSLSTAFVTSQQSLMQPPLYAGHPKPLFSQSGNTNTVTLSTSSPQASFPNNQISGLRRSSRLFGNRTSSSSSSVKENNKNQGENKLLSPRVPAKKTKAKLTWTPQQLNEKNKTISTGGGVEGGIVGGGVGGVTITDSKLSTVLAASNAQQVMQLQRQSANGLMYLLQDFGKAYTALMQFDCKTALDCFVALPTRHYNTGWVLSQVGRAHFEMSNYQKAESVFAELHQLERYRCEGMELYSTVLWHLQLEVQLSTLSQELTEIDKMSPEAWCATGNCFSLQKEHDVAIRFFQRAIQVDPSFAYAYTLLGHEYVLIEELDKAMAAFRNSVRIDPRHYNAWYGIGMVYYKQEKFGLAEVHFNKALAINPHSSALLCHLGVVQHALKKSDSALKTLGRAIDIDAKNPLCKFHRASILFATDRHQEALAELEELKDIVPKESLVYFLIGKVHKKLGNTHLALVNFSWAMDLDPKGTNNHIKEAIDKRYMADDEDVSIAMSSDGVAVAGPSASGGTADPMEGPSHTSSSFIMDADDFQLRAVESDESL